MVSQEDIMTIHKSLDKNYSVFAALYMYVASFASQLFSSMIGSFLLDSPKGTDEISTIAFILILFIR